MQLGLYAHPWDLRDLDAHGGLARLRELGFADLSLATAYHAGRWLTPWSADGLVRFLHDGTVHFQPRGEYGALTPQVSDDVRGMDSPLAAAVDKGAESGVGVRAWTVLFHNSRLGRLHPGSCVRNALGDPYTHALCPARPEVQQYGLALVGDIAAHTGLGAVELEAFGWMGHRHGSHHDKSSFSTDAFTDFLLSYCFCTACVDGLGRAGADGDALRERASRQLHETLRDGDAMAPDGVPAEETMARLAAVLGSDGLQAMLAHRRETLRANLQAVRRSVPSSVAVALHLQPAPLFTGSQVGAGLADVADLVDEVVFTHYGEDPDRIAAAWRDRTVTGCGARMALWPRAPQFRDATDLQKVRRLAAAHGVGAIAIYHLGLLPRRTLERAAEALCR